MYIYRIISVVSLRVSAIFAIIMLLGYLPLFSQNPIIIENALSGSPPSEWDISGEDYGISGVAGGSLLLIPLACSLFGISNDVAMQVVAIGFIIGIVQDSAETALNSSTDVLFTATACRAAERKHARRQP